MSITYEEALATLEAMFGAPWSRETLDKVLRIEKGHMENTCDRILNYGSQNDPQVLIDRLESGQPVGGETSANTAADEQLARQLATEHVPASTSNAKKRMGKPTVLPEDFLRIPGYKIRGGGGASGAGVTSDGTAMDDETLARMLQDELFSQELARNPDFAHLAGGRRPARTSNTSATNMMGAFGIPSSAPGQRRSGGGPGFASAHDEGPKIMEKLSEMGDTARRRLQMLATQFEQKLNQHRNLPNSQNGFLRGGLGGSNDTAAERRGLLDDEEDTIEFEMRKNK